MENKLRIQFKELKKHVERLERKLTTQNEVLFTRLQAAEFLSVSLTTLRTWTENGIVIGRRLGGRVYYLKSEIITSMN